jgi:glycosyltransferase involved in cell wall biosynthesis
MRVAVVAEYYPRAVDPVLGVWAHRQALAARDAGADIRVVVLHRLVPPKATLRAGDLRAIRERLLQPRRTLLNGLPVEYVPFVAPPRSRTYGQWGAWAAPTLRVALHRLRSRFAFDLVHAHYAVPAGDAVRRVAPQTPLVISVHGGDVLWTVHRGAAARENVERALGHARLVLANSHGTAELTRRHGARDVRVVHLGTDRGDAPRAAGAPRPPTLVTVGHLVARKRNADVIRALAALRDRHPDLRYVIVGDGPEREPLAALARSLGVGDRVELRGALPHDEAVRAARDADLFVLPSVAEAFGVAYVEAMAGGVPAIGSAGEPGPEEIVLAGGGLRLVAPGDVPALTAEIDALLRDERGRRELGDRARETVERAFTWRRCGEETAAAYRQALGR